VGGRPVRARVAAESACRSVTSAGVGCRGAAGWACRSDPWGVGAAWERRRPGAMPPVARREGVPSGVGPAALRRGPSRRGQSCRERARRSSSPRRPHHQVQAPDEGKLRRAEAGWAGPGWHRRSAGRGATRGHRLSAPWAGKRRREAQRQDGAGHRPAQGRVARRDGTAAGRPATRGHPDGPAVRSDVGARRRPEGRRRPVHRPPGGVPAQVPVRVGARVRARWRLGAAGSPPGRGPARVAVGPAASVGS
jgi:hypothetical protein